MVLDSFEEEFQFEAAEDYGVDTESEGRDVCARSGGYVEGRSGDYHVFFIGEGYEFFYEDLLGNKVVVG